MTLIKSLTMEGFKSFAKHTQFLFSNKFNVILGPNGSGKSNVLDAICFVLGRLSSKSLRAEKTASLIYNGGKSKQPAKKAIVSIVFDNSKHEFPVESDELKITRIVRQDGQSTYKINDKRVTRQQVLDVLSYAKIDPDGYNIVLQGDITRFVNMSSIERRQIIEEIAGISSYEDKKQKALNELERVEGRIKEAEIILAERKTYLKELKKQYEQALKYKRMKENIDRNKATYLYLQREKKRKERDKIEKDIKKINEEINKINSKISKLREEEKKLNEEINKITKSIEEKGEKEQVRVHKEVEELKVIIATKEAELKSKRTEIERITNRKEQLENNIKEAKEEIKRINSEINGLEEEKKNIKKQLKEVENNIKSFEREHDINLITKIEKELNEIEEKIEKTSNEINSLVEEKQNLLREKDKLEVKIENLEAQIEKIKIIEKEHKEELEVLKKQKQDFKNVILELNKSLSKDSELAVKIMEYKKRVSSLKEEIERLKIKTLRMQERISNNKAIREILNNKDKFGKIFGLASQLGSVSKKYSLALDVAAGGRADSIVVDNDETAAKCIKYLKREKLGVATFLPLNKIRGIEVKKEVKELLKANGVIGLAYELIRTEPKFKRVFQYIFGDTIVVEDIDVARRLGVGSARMVTLDGDLIERSGAMHGGYRSKRIVSFQTENDVIGIKELEKKEEELKNLEEEIKSMEEEREENTKKIEELRRKRSELEGEIIKREKSLHLDTSDLDANKRQKSLLREELKKVESEIERIDNEISKKNNVVVELKIKRQELKNKISELRNPVVVAEMSALEKKRSELNNEITRIDEKIKNKKERLNSQEEEIKRIEKIIKQIIKDKERFNEEIKKLKEEMKEKKEELSKKEKLQAEFYNKFKKLFEERNKLNEKLQKTTNQIMNLESETRRLEQRMNNLSLKKATVSGELSGLEREFEDYKDVELFKNKDEAELKYEIKKFEKLLEEMGNINLKALEMYEEVEREYKELMAKKDRLSKEREDVLKMIKEVEEKKKELFMKTFELVNDHFKKFFTKLSTKGEAYLKLEDPENPFEKGVVIRVKITSQKFLDIRALSGGEKTLTALALIFAIQEFQPASFYILDEVDAALDKKNSEKLAELIKEYSKKAQYIVISHNDAIITAGDTLFGVSMDKDGISKVVSLKV